MSGADAAFCADLVRTRDFPRYAATLFLAAEERRALLALYAFNAEISRVRDSVSQPIAGEGTSARGTVEDIVQVYDDMAAFF